MTRLDRLKVRLYGHAMRKLKGNKTKAAEWMGISIRTLRNWERGYDLREDAYADNRYFRRKTQFYNGTE